MPDQFLNAPSIRIVLIKVFLQVKDGFAWRTVMEGATCPEELHVEPHDEKIQTFRGRIRGEPLIEMSESENIYCVFFSHSTSPVSR
jgi:hypothetical protein